MRHLTKCFPRWGVVNSDSLASLKAYGSHRGDNLVPITRGKITCGWKFILRILGQRDAHRITDSFRQQGRYPDTRLDPAAVPVASLGHTDVKRVNHPFSFIAAISFRYASTITIVLLDFSDTTTL